ncbi:hypothetical protein [Vibrio sp. WXL210]|uniref:hypothetical protein n=1 Tax=Vibrio sp. WXL210 TaxID=3450709 RepID=UPI003EC8DD82
MKKSIALLVAASALTAATAQASDMVHQYVPEEETCEVSKVADGVLQEESRWSWMNAGKVEVVSNFANTARFTEMSTQWDGTLSASQHGHYRVHVTAAKEYVYPDDIDVLTSGWSKDLKIVDGDVDGYIFLGFDGVAGKSGAVASPTDVGAMTTTWSVECLK